MRATPKGGRDAIDGIGRLADGSMVLKARVRVAPEGGAANGVLIRLIAAAAGVAPSAVALIRGQTGRNKVFRLTGDAARLAAALEQKFGAATGSEMP